MANNAFSTQTDLRARLVVPSGYNVPFDGHGLELSRNGIKGILFPLTPTISTQTQANYSQMNTIHSNYQQNSYVNTTLSPIQVNSAWVVQSEEEAHYLMGVMHFLRVVTKMHFGEQDSEAGTPPPVLKFSAYGSYNFDKIPVVVSSFVLNYPDDVDFVEYDGTQVPTMMSIAIDLLPQYSTTNQRNFNLTAGSNDFVSGNLYKDGFI